MNDNFTVEHFVSACAAVKSTVSLMRWIMFFWLTKFEKDILCAAKETGHIQVVPVDSGIEIVANSTNFHGPFRLDYLEAFGRLCRRGWIKSVDDNGLFSLTPKSMRKARKLTKRDE